MTCSEKKPKMKFITEQYVLKMQTLQIETKCIFQAVSYCQVREKSRRLPEIQQGTHDADLGNA